MDLFDRFDRWNWILGCMQSIRHHGLFTWMGEYIHTDQHFHERNYMVFSSDHHAHWVFRLPRK